MPEPLTMLALGGLAVLMLAGGGGGPPGGKLPPLDTKGLDAVTEWKATPQGLARYWRKAFIPSVAVNLQACGVKKVAEGVYKGARVIVYELTSSPVPGQTAIDLAKIAYNAKAAVLVTANFWTKTGGSCFMAVVPYEQRAEWSKLGRQWAIEFDDQAGEDSVPEKVPPKIDLTDRKKYAATPAKTPGGESTVSAWLFDANMTDQEQTDAANMLNRDDLAPEFYDAQAIAAETAGHGGTSHGVHPKCAKMMRAKAATLRAAQAKKDKPPPTTTKKDPWGKIPGGTQAKTPGTLDQVPPKEEPPPVDDIVVPPVDVPPAKPSTFQHQIVMLDPTTGLPADEGSMFGIIQSPASIAVQYTGNGERWTEMLPLNPGLKKTGGSSAKPWPTPSGYVTLPTNWVDPSVPLATSL